MLKALLESMFPRRRSTYIWDEVENQQDPPIPILGAGLLESRGNRNLSGTSGSHKCFTMTADNCLPVRNTGKESDIQSTILFVIHNMITIDDSRTALAILAHLAF